VIDFVEDMPEETLYTVTKRFINKKTLVLGISTTFFIDNGHTKRNGLWITDAMINVIKKIKQEYPDIKIVSGGQMAEKLPSLGIIDATIMSYTTASEEILLEYLNHLSRGGDPPESEPNIDGRIDRPIYNKAKNPIYNIEVDDFMWSKQDAILFGEPLPLDLSRGCIFACKFCQFPHIGKKKLDYIRGMDYVKEELIHNYKNFGTTSYFLLDDTFNDTETKVKAFHSMVKSLPFKINFTTYLRADLIHRFPDTAYYLKDTGLYGAFFGIESLHPSASKLVGKAWSGKHGREYIPKLYHDIWNKKVPIHTNFIVGITGEPIESVYNTADWFIQNELHSIYFERLAIFGLGNDKAFSIKSEFDRNTEKYGYTILETPNNIIFPNWKNDIWTRESGTFHKSELNKKVNPYNKIGVWGIPTLMWYGISKEEIENKVRKDFDNTFFFDIHQQKMNEYIKTLLTLETDV